MSLLSFHDVTLRFGGVTALDGLSFDVMPGEVFAIVGPNGAGKSTAFNVISRLYEPAAGGVTFDGDDLLARRAHEMPGLGIARTFQNIELFENATVLQNLLIGRHHVARANPLAQLIFLPSVRAAERAHREAVERVIDFLDLQTHRDARIAGLPYGVRKVVEIGRALACEPRVLLLDEPASGLSAEETREVAFWVEDIARLMGVTVVMVEHDMSLVGAVADRVLAMADGKRLSLGTPDAVRADPAVIEAYLGASA